MGEHGAHRVDRNRHARCLRPFLEQAAALAIGVGQCLAVVTAAHARTDPGDLVDRVPQALAVDAEIVSGDGHGSAAPPTALRAVPPPRPGEGWHSWQSPRFNSY